MAKHRDASQRIYIAQGEHAISDQEDDLITTILGSCVAVCLRDPELNLGGMNHILVPEGGPTNQNARGAGALAMETLINAMMKRGAQRHRLTAKVFGGAAVVEGLSDIGLHNAEFVFGFLRDDGIRVLSQSVGGNRARQVRFWPASGRAQQRFVHASDAPTEVREQPAPSGNDLELF